MTTHTDRQELRALVVDDDEIVREMVSFALQQEGFTCDHATDGEQALELMASKDYDLLVTDLRMPNKHGHALVVDVLNSHPRPKIIVHTCIDDPRLTKDMIVRGVDDVVYKPTNYEALAAKARGLVVRGRTTIEEPEMVAENADAVKKAKGADDFNRREVTVMQKELGTKRPTPVSDAALDVYNMVNTHSFDAGQVAAAVGRVPGLAAAVLQLANNQFYNPTGKPIVDIKQAVTRIGQERVADVAHAMCTGGTDG